MMKFPTKRSKSTQYVIGGTVGVLILALWISLPLLSGSSMEGSVAAGNPFKSKVADLSALSDIPSEGGAPGSPLSGEMINNPATSGEDIASSLFQSGIGEETPEASASADASASAPDVPSASGGAPMPSAGGPKAKLAAAASITGGNSNSMTAGGIHNKFFGSGNNKAEVAPALPADMKKMAAPDKKGTLAALLSNTADKSKLAANSGSMDASKGGASAAFTNTAKAGGSADLNSDLEAKSLESGLQLGQTAQDLKKSDPSLSKSKVTPPSKPEDATDESEEMKNQIKMMIIQMVLKAAFAGMGLAV
ncbi:MAG: hypothetical protein ACYC2I_01195 [Elusimicrobiales bacterium]